MDEIKLTFLDVEKVNDLLLKEYALKNIEIAKQMRNEIIRLKKFTLESNSEPNSKSVDSTQELEDELNENNNSDYEFYYGPIININNYELSDKELDDEIENYLPNIDNDNVGTIIFRIKAEIMKEISEYQKLISTETDKDLLDEIKSVIEFNQRKLISLDRIINKPESDEKLVTKKNKIMFVTTNTGNYSIIRDIKEIPEEYYSEFKELIDSIIDGSFKNLVPFNSNNKSFNGISEVKDFKVRVVFARINKDTFIILTAFMKKFDKSKLYLDSLGNIIQDYKRNIDYYKNKANDEEYMMEQENIKELVFKTLTKEKVNIMKKGDING